jgi:hypothetical protein
VLIWYGLAAAVRATFQRRGTVIPGRTPIALSIEYADDPSHAQQWAAFTQRLLAEATPSLGVVIDEVSEFVLPPAIAAATAQSFNQPGIRKIGGSQLSDISSLTE